MGGEEAGRPPRSDAEDPRLRTDADDDAGRARFRFRPTSARARSAVDHFNQGTAALAPRGGDGRDAAAMLELPAPHTGRVRKARGAAFDFENGIFLAILDIDLPVPWPRSSRSMISVNGPKGH